MAVSDNVNVARTFYEAWAKRDPDQGATVIADDCEFIDVPRGEIQGGPDGYRHDYERWRTAFPDGTVEITNIISEGDLGCCRLYEQGLQRPIRIYSVANQV